MSKKKTDNTPDYAQMIKFIALEIFEEQPHKSFNYKQILKKFQQEPFYEKAIFFLSDVDEEQVRHLLMVALGQLCLTDAIEETERGKYRLYPKEHFVIGKIDVTTSGNAYVMNDEYEEDIFIARGKTLNALKGDKVRVSLYATRRDKRAEGEVVEIIERARAEFTGIVQISNRFAFLSSDNQRNGVDIFIPLNKLNGAEQGVKAVARITEWPEGAKNPSGEIIQVLGMPGENDTEMDAILVEYGFPLKFPAEVELEAEKIPFEIPKKEIAKRKDFRGVATFTIDPVDAKDFDDALSVKNLPNGNVEVGVHIADVSHYVRPGSALEEEGYDRATSIYLVDRVIPMLPEKLSNAVCSLRPGEDKLCFSAVFEITNEAEVVSEWFGKTIIHSQHRFSYEEAQEVIETKEGPMREEVLKLQALALQLRKERFKKGAITFEKVEVKFRLDKKGMPIDVYLKENKDSNKLIEEFMLLANRKVAEFIGKKLAHKKGKELPFVYRVHDTPVTKKLETFAAFALRFGHTINTRTDRDIAHSFPRTFITVIG